MINAQQLRGRLGVCALVALAACTQALPRADSAILGTNAPSYGTVIPAVAPTATPTTVAVTTPAPGAPYVVASSQGIDATGTASAITYAVPTGATTGDVLIAPVTYSDYAVRRAVVAPSGWIAVADPSLNGATAQQVFKHTVAAGDPTSWTFTINGTPIYDESSMMHAVRNAGAIVAHTSDGTGQIVAGASVPAPAGGLLLSFFSENDGTSASGSNIVTPVTLSSLMTIGGVLDQIAEPPCCTTEGISQTTSSAALTSLLGLTLNGGTYFNPWATTTVAISAGTPATNPSGVQNVLIPDQAEHFADSMCANIHTSETNTAYGNSAVFPSTLYTLGIHCVRDGISGGVISTVNAIASHGIKFDFISDSTQTATTLQAWHSYLTTPGSDAAYEGWNEWDISHPSGSNSTWPADDDAGQKLLFSTVKAFANNPMVIGPSVTTGGGATSVGNLQAYMDCGAVHGYLAGRGPDGVGFGGTIAPFGNYGEQDYNIAYNRQIMGLRPTCMTEEGWSENTADSNSVPAYIKSRYTLRAYLENWRKGVTQTYLYQSLDDGSPGYQYYGMAYANGTQKPAFTALENFIAMFNDPGAAFTTTPIPVKITGLDPTARVLPFQKRDGSSWVAVWLETQDSDPNTQALTPTTPQTATLTWGSVPTSLATHVINDDGSRTDTTLTPASTNTVTVSSNVTVIQIGAATLAAAATPAPGATPAATPAPTASPGPALPVPTGTPNGVVAHVQFVGANNGGGATYTGTFPSAPATGSRIFAAMGTGGCSSYTTSLAGGTYYDSCTDNSGISSQTGQKVAASGESATQTINESGGFADALLLNIAGTDPSYPIPSPAIITTGTNQNVTCGAMAAPRAGSLEYLLIAMNGGTGNSSITQTPTAPAGYTYLGNSNGQFGEFFAFVSTATSATNGTTYAAQTVNMATTSGSAYLTQSICESIVFQPPP